MKLDIVAGSKNDEFYTPAYAVKPILKYINPEWTVWCPFDTTDSLFVKELVRHGCKVINSHIWNGQDFFKFEPPEYDCVISNPPYSIKTEVLERCFEIGKPFAMLVGAVGLFESQRRFEMFKNNSFEVMYFNRRVCYFKDYSEQVPSARPPFSSVYICSGLLNQTIVFEEIERTA